MSPGAGGFELLVVLGVTFEGTLVNTISTDWPLAPVWPSLVLVILKTAVWVVYPVLVAVKVIVPLVNVVVLAVIVTVLLLLLILAVKPVGIVGTAKVQLSLSSWPPFLIVAVVVAPVWL